MYQVVSADAWQMISDIIQNRFSIGCQHLLHISSIIIMLSLSLSSWSLHCKVHASAHASVLHKFCPLEFIMIERPGELHIDQSSGGPSETTHLSKQANKGVGLACY